MSTYKTLVSEYSDILHDYLAMFTDFGPQDELVLEYRAKLEQAGLDINPDNYTHYKTYYGIFSHYEHLPTGICI